MTTPKTTARKKKKRAGLEAIVTAETAVYAVLGDPIEHSLSPVFQNEAFRGAALDALYVALRVSQKDLPAFIEGARRTSFKGFNATLPLKEALAPLCDKLSEPARIIGAVNTVEFRGGKLIGHNTDGPGFLQSLREELGFNPRRKKVCVLGAGGASRAITAALAQAGAGPIAICNRTVQRAHTLVRELSKALPKAALSHRSLRQSDLIRALQEVDLVVQTTPMGLDGRGLIPLPWGAIPKETIVADIVYRPRITPLMTEARRRGHPVVGGLGMLLHQGALSFAIWTGKKPDLARMRKAAERALR